MRLKDPSNIRRDALDKVSNNSQLAQPTTHIRAITTINVKAYHAHISASRDDMAADANAIPNRRY